MAAATDVIRIGVIGLSPGNGHPYSWSAIVNGYLPEAMAECPFPAIPEYLSKQNLPKDRIEGVQVTHIWTQDPEISKHVAKAACIETVVNDCQDMIGRVDAVLLARDDAENHYEMSAPFIEAGLPIYIDKPIAFSVAEAQRILALERYPGQIFTCSALRYAREFSLSMEELSLLGTLTHVHATAPKDWDKYAVHIVEPVLSLTGTSQPPNQMTAHEVAGLRRVNVTWPSGLRASFETTGKASSPIAIRLSGQRAEMELVFSDTFVAFKRALQTFIEGIRTGRQMIDPGFILNVIAIIERGRTPLGGAGRKESV